MADEEISPEGALTNMLLEDVVSVSMIGDRIYSGKLPKGLKYPFVRQYNVSDTSDANDTTGTLRVQYSVFSKSQTEARKVARQFRKYLSGKMGIRDGVRFRKIKHIITNDLIVEDDTEVFETAVDFRVNYALID